MVSNQFDTITWSFDRESGIGKIQLSRGDSLNALSSTLKSDIVEGFDEFRRIDEKSDGIKVRVVIVESAGEKAFCVGSDIHELDERSSGDFDIQDVYAAPEIFNGPVIAKIDGYALGGGLELALACDFRIASNRSTIGLPEVDIGLIPGGGGTQRLAEIVGSSLTKRLTMTGEHVSADTAQEWGILDDVVEAENLDEAVDQFSNQIAEKPPTAIRALKDVINMYRETGLEEGRRYERRVINELHHTEDAAEGRTAFIEDREPNWQGK
ncbi:enoyl-CoA hydratase/isomerase family protein [Halopenitus persicus]|uniref:enoyl-CoA hydratase/isomerase family protein n=1 Tax=Halopenitus persicus TaxID=1048396 RepID=UPI000BBAB2D5|nr:enoyl-CoA hydratase/isomerase family protein [Halopenitus persicus]